MQLRSVRPFVRNTLRAFACVTVPVGPFGLEIDDVALHQSGDGCWVSLPARPMIDRDGHLVRSETGKISYAPVLRWDSRAAREAFCEGVIRLVRERHPEIFADGGAS